MSRPENTDLNPTRRGPSSRALTVAMGWLAGMCFAAAQPSGPPGSGRLPESATVYRDLAYVAGGHERQKLDLYLPSDGTNLPLIINIHGGAFKMGSKEQGVPTEYLAQGYAVASINYRLSQHAKFPAQIEDCKAAVRWLRAHAAEYRLDSTRVAAWGASAGGHLAAMLGTTGDVREFDVGDNLNQSSRVQAVVDYFGPTDFLQMDAHRLPDGQLHDPADSPESLLIGGALQENKERATRANPITYVTSTAPPFLICHGDADLLVPHHQSELLVAALEYVGVPVTFYTVKGAGHGRFNDPAVARLTREFLARHLKSTNSERPAWGDWQSWGDQGDGTYRNPVLPADYSDIDCIRVGSDYYAISSTFQYSPGMVILHSKDLVNWTIRGHAVPDLTNIGPEMNWDRMNRFGRGIWAGAIRYHAGKFWVYFGTPDEGYFMTRATNVAGPWSPLTHVLKAKGWDDCCPFWDDDGQGYLIGSQFDLDPVNGKKYNIHLWKLTPDGKALVEGSDLILYQSPGSEANKLYKWNGTYYHYFSEVKGEGRVPMMGRAKNITGPYERRQIGHVIQRVDYEPNQGGIVQSEGGDWWFFTHHGSGDWSGRIASLLPVTWTNGWPIIGEIGADGIGNMVWSANKPVKYSPRITPQTGDEFSAATLAPQWEWHYQPRAEKWSLTERPGFLRLRAFRGLDGDNLLKVGNVLTQRPLRTTTNIVTVKMDVAGMANGQSAGLFQFTTAGCAGVGVCQTNNVRFLIYRSSLKTEPGAEVKSDSVWLRTTWGLDGVAHFSRSLDGQTFESVGEPYQMKWASYRGDRIGLFSYNPDADAGYVDVDWFHYEYGGRAAGPERKDSN